MWSINKILINFLTLVLLALLSLFVVIILFKVLMPSVYKKAKDLLVKKWRRFTGSSDDSSTEEKLKTLDESKNKGDKPKNATGKKKEESKTDSLKKDDKEKPKDPKVTTES